MKEKERKGKGGKNLGKRARFRWRSFTPGPWRRLGRPSLSEPSLSLSPETRRGAPSRNSKGRGNTGRPVPLAGDLEASEVHPERGLVTFHRRLTSSPA